MKKLMVVTVIMLAVVSAAFGYEKLLGGGGDEGANSIYVNDDGTIIGAGYTNSFSGYDRDCYIFKLDRKGNIVWQNSFGGFDTDVAYAVERVTDGNYMVSGLTYSYGAGEDDIYIAKFDTLGNVLWTFVYGGTGFDAGYSLAPTADGGAIVAGYSSSYGEDYTPFLIKVTSSGDTAWTKIIHTTHSSGFVNINRAHSGNFIITGFIDSGADNFDIYSALINPSGNFIWQESYGGTSRDIGSCVKPTADGGYIIAGETQPLADLTYRLYMVKIDSAGKALWSKEYRDFGETYSQSVVQLPDGDYVLGGCSMRSGSTHQNVFLIKTNHMGDTLYTRTYGSNSMETCSDIENIGNEVVLAGFTQMTGDEQIYIIKTDTMGYSGEIEIALTRGWNTISYPLDDTVSISTAMPSVIASYEYSPTAAAYVETDSLYVGKVVWVLSPTDTTITLTSHYPVYQNSSQLLRGWTSIGTVSKPIPVGDLDRYPQIIGVYCYNPFTRTYYIPEVLVPGNGYLFLSRYYVTITL
jgi:hypothetical protein